MQTGVRRPDEVREIPTDERCHILELSGRADDPALSIARARVEPGVTTELHVLEIDERYVIVEGSGVVEVGGVEEAVGPGDVVLIPAGVPQRVANPDARDRDLVFYCLCTPPWRPEAYRALD